MVITSVLNAINRPIHAAAFTFSQIFIIYIPIALFLSKFFDVKGIFSAVVISYIITSALLMKYFKKFLKNSIIKNKNKLGK
jgi:Na+-driven multidrug efflux pump